MYNWTLQSEGLAKLNTYKKEFVHKEAFQRSRRLVDNKRSSGQWVQRHSLKKRGEFGHLDGFLTTRRTRHGSPIGGHRSRHGHTYNKETKGEGKEAGGTTINHWIYQNK